MKLKRVSVIGAGAWGTVVAKVLAEKGHTVSLWSFEKDLPEIIREQGENSRYLPGIPLPTEMIVSSDIQEVATDVDVILLAVPSLFLLDIAKQIVGVPNILEGKTSIGILSKGLIEINNSPTLITEALEQYLPGSYKKKLVYISGPSHAEEVGRGKMTGLITASRSPKEAVKMRHLLSSENLFVFSSLDVVGVQVCAIMKNVIAIAFGVMDALKETDSRFGDNTESLLLASGLHELQTFGFAMGATHPETFTSIAGVGDLDVTCRSQYGRNRRFGQEIVTKDILAPFNGIEDALNRIHEIGYLPEGLVACYHVARVVKEKKLKLNITEGLYSILNKEVAPSDMVSAVVQKARPITKLR